MIVPSRLVRSSVVSVLIRFITDDVRVVGSSACKRAQSAHVHKHLTTYFPHEVTGICGFWDGSCNDKICGAGITILLFTQGTGWVTIYKKCGPVPGTNSLDAELGGCAMLIESLDMWLRKSRKSS